MSRFFLIVLFAMLPSVTFAQQQIKDSITLTMTLEEANLAMKKLGELPWSSVNPLMQKLIAQINTQLLPQPKPEQ